MPEEDWRQKQTYRVNH